MGELVNLKRSDDGHGDPMATEIEKPRYEWGTCLNPEGEVVKRLGLEGINAGAKVHITGIGFIESVTVDDDERGKRTSVRLQLTDVAVDQGQQVDQANVLYGNQS